MKRSLLLATALVAPIAAFCTSEENDKGYYVTLGAGVVIPGKDSSTTSDSSSVLYSPTSVGTSLFTLPNVHWENNYKTGFELNAAVGQRMSERWRLEGEFIYQRMTRDIGGEYDWQEVDAETEAVINRDYNNPLHNTDSPVNLYTLMANTYYDFRNNSQWTPFAGIGIGLSVIDSPSTKEDGTLHVAENDPPLDIEAPTVEESPSLYGTAFAWQVKLGVDYAFTDKMSFALLYRFLGTTKFKSSSSEIVTNPDISSESATFTVHEDDVAGLLDHSVNLSWTYRF